MNARHIEGRARLLPDAVNTDYIISSRRKRQIPEMSRLAGYIFEDLPQPLDEPVSPGDILVAGEDFACGSAMEAAVDVLIASGVRAVIARSAARTFHRNAINGGLPLLIAHRDVADEGDILQICYAADGGIYNATRHERVRTAPVPDLAVRLAAAGGLIKYCRREGMPPPGLLP